MKCDRCVYKNGASCRADGDYRIITFEMETGCKMYQDYVQIAKNCRMFLFFRVKMRKFLNEEDGKKFCYSEKFRMEKIKEWKKMYDEVKSNEKALESLSLG